jgi:hypothetical protein
MNGAPDKDFAKMDTRSPGVIRSNELRGFEDRGTAALLRGECMEDRGARFGVVGGYGAICWGALVRGDVCACYRPW